VIKNPVKWMPIVVVWNVVTSELVMANVVALRLWERFEKIMQLIVQVCRKYIENLG